MAGRCRQYLSLRNFLLEYNEPVNFIQFQFGLKRVYVIWRVIWAIYHSAWLVSRVVNARMEHGGNGLKWFIYLTNWSYLSLTLSSILELIATLYVQYARKDILSGNCVVSPWYMKTVWVVFNIGCCSAVLVTLLFWGLLYTAGKEITTTDIGLHILNSVYVLINLSVTASPQRIYHFFHTIVFSSMYVIFSFVYHVSGGTSLQGESYIYPQLDWEKPGTAAIYSVFVIFIVIPIVHIVLFFIYSVRVAIFKMSRHRSVSVNIQESGIYKI